MFRFRYAYDSRCGGSWWLIEKRFLFIFWRKYKKYRYKILEDGSPNINEVMDYVDWLNLGPNEYEDYSPDDLINVRKRKMN